MQNQSVINIPDVKCSREDSLSFITTLSTEGLLKSPIMASATLGDRMLLRNGAAMTIHSIRRDQSKTYQSFKVSFVGLACVELEYDGSGLSMDSEYADEKPAPFDVIFVEHGVRNDH